MEHYNIDKDILDIVNALIKAELENAPSFLHIEKNVRGYQSIIPCNIDFGYLGEIFSEIELKALIHAIINRSRETSAPSSGGSTSPVNSLYCLYCTLYPENGYEMARWIHENTVNLRYEPGLNPSEKISKQADSKRRNLLEQERQTITKREKHVRESKKATINLPNAIQRGDLKAVKVMIEKGGDIEQALLEVDSLRSLMNEQTKTAMIEYLNLHGLKLNNE